MTEKTLCKACSAEVPGVVETWWVNKPWRDPALHPQPERELWSETVARRDSLISMRDPACKHDFTAFTVANCDNCQYYTKKMLQYAIEAKTAVIAA